MLFAVLRQLPLKGKYHRCIIDRITRVERVTGRLCHRNMGDRAICYQVILQCRWIFFTIRGDLWVFNDKAIRKHIKITTFNTQSALVPTNKMVNICSLLTICFLARITKLLCNENLLLGSEIWFFIFIFSRSLRYTKKVCKNLYFALRDMAHGHFS